MRASGSAHRFVLGFDHHVFARCADCSPRECTAVQMQPAFGRGPCTRSRPPEHHEMAERRTQVGGREGRIQLCAAEGSVRRHEAARGGPLEGETPYFDVIPAGLGQRRARTTRRLIDCSCGSSCCTEVRPSYLSGLERNGFLAARLLGKPIPPCCDGYLHGRWISTAFCQRGGELSPYQPLRGSVGHRSCPLEFSRAATRPIY